MSEVPLYHLAWEHCRQEGSYEGGVSYERGTPVHTPSTTATNLETTHGVYLM